LTSGMGIYAEICWEDFISIHIGQTLTLRRVIIKIYIGDRYYGAGGGVQLLQGPESQGAPFCLRPNSTVKCIDFASFLISLSCLMDF
jgi:hypothetical protein